MSPLAQSATTSNAPSPAAPKPPIGALDRFFRISERGSTLPREIRGGVATFFTMAYILVLNPIILSGSPDVSGNQLDFAQVSATTSLAAGVMTILFGLIARLPFALAAGLGINSFLATTVVGDLTWAEAMGLVVINGLIIVLLAVTGLRRLVFDAVPMQLKLAITAGIASMIVSIPLLGASSPKVSTTSRSCQPKRGFSISGSISARSGTPCGIITICRGLAPYTR